MVRLEDVIGTAKVVYWPLNRVGSVAGSAELAAAPAPSAPSAQARR